jgi:hypothetical protein
MQQAFRLQTAGIQTRRLGSEPHDNCTNLDMLQLSATGKHIDQVVPTSLVPSTCTSCCLCVISLSVLLTVCR